METQNLWPDFAVESLKSPKSILKEQAGFLMEKTNNILSAEVETVQSPRGGIVHNFYVVAPAMNNYRYKILSIMHSVIYYPLSIVWSDGEYEDTSQEEFIDSLSLIFNHQDTTRVISSLLSQSLAE